MDMPPSPLLFSLEGFSPAPSPALRGIEGPTVAFLLPSQRASPALQSLRLPLARSDSGGSQSATPTKSDGVGSAGDSATAGGAFDQLLASKLAESAPDANAGMAQAVQRLQAASLDDDDDSTPRTSAVLPGLTFTKSYATVAAAPAVSLLLPPSVAASPPMLPPPALPESKTAPVAGLDLSHFDLLRVLGRGSFGKVFLVRKKDSHALYALKVLRKRSVVKRNVVDNTISERRVLEDVCHPFIVNLRFAFQTPEKLYLALDYAPGGELFTRLEQVREMSEEVARFYIAELVLALEHLHSLRVIYRDLKSENVLIGADGHLLLTDMGFCKRDFHVTERRARSCVGTWQTMAPEVIQPTPAGHGLECDWWSLGALMYEMIIGVTPFDGPNDAAIKKRILTAKLRYPSWISFDCRTLLKGLLKRPVHKRLGYHGASEIKAHAFFEDIDWKRLEAKHVVPPFVPRMVDDADTSHFDEKFTLEPPIDTPMASPGSGSPLPSSAMFRGFSYVGNDDEKRG